MKSKRFLAVDLGASGGKCFAAEITPESLAMNEAHRFEHEAVTFHLPGAAGALIERAYWNDTLIYSNIIEGLRACRRSLGPELDSIGIDAWGSDGALLTATGDMLGKMYAYRDHRLDNMVQEVKARINPERIYELTGIHFQPFNISNQLLWLRMNRPEWLSAGAKFMPVPTLFSWYLGGEPAVDSSWASVTQLMEARTRQWSREITAALGIPDAILPKTLAPGAVTGKLRGPLAEALGLNQPAIVAVASHDTASAFAAAPAANKSTALIISSGTWSLVGRLVPEPITSTAALDANLSNEGGVGNIRLLRNCMGTWLVQELRRCWRNADGRDMPWDELDRLTAEAPAFTAFLDPDDPSFYNPTDMEQAMADFLRRTGQTMPSGRGAMARMVYESLALKYRMIDEIIANVCGSKADVVHVVGGGSRNQLLNRFTAEATGKPVIAGPVEATAIGNLLLQALAMGVFKNLDEALPLIQHSFSISEFKPQGDSAWQQAYDKFKAILAKTK